MKEVIKKGGFYRDENGKVVLKSGWWDSKWYQKFAVILAIIAFIWGIYIYCY